MCVCVHLLIPLPITVYSYFCFSIYLSLPIHLSVFPFPLSSLLSNSFHPPPQFLSESPTSPPFPHIGLSPVSFLCLWQVVLGVRSSLSSSSIPSPSSSSHFYYLSSPHPPSCFVSSLSFPCTFLSTFPPSPSSLPSIVSNPILTCPSLSLLPYQSFLPLFYLILPRHPSRITPSYLSHPFLPYPPGSRYSAYKALPPRIYEVLSATLPPGFQFYEESPMGLLGWLRRILDEEGGIACPECNGGRGRGREGCEGGGVNDMIDYFYHNKEKRNRRWKLQSKCL